MKFSDLKCCPFCGNDEFYEKQYAKGPIYFNMRFDGEETHNETMYDSLTTIQSGRVYCNHCEKYLGNMLSDALGKEAERAINNTLKQLEK